LRLERDKAVFSDSRLYRQAEETADNLLLNLQVPVPLGEAVACLREDGGRLVFRPGELERPIRILQEAIERSIDSVSPYHAIPALFRAVAFILPARLLLQRSRSWQSACSAGYGLIARARQRRGWASYGQRAWCTQSGY
jgi:hypothetical protein